MENPISGVNSIVAFNNSQGLKCSGTLVHITRTSILFELYNPYSIVQLSEVLKNLQVLRGERIIYNGKAVVSHIVSTGLMVIVSVTLVDPWSDLTGLFPGKGLRDETMRFLNDWDASHNIMPEYQLIVSSLGNFLGELSRWLQEAETGVLGNLEEDKTSLEKEFYEEISETVGPKVYALYEKFECEAAKIPPEEIMQHKAFAQRILHPLTLCSPFVHRTFSKPLGYAGDYEMVNMMLRESKTTGKSIYAQVVDDYHLKAAPVIAHCNRIDMLEERLKNEAIRVTNEGRIFTVLNIGCGPAVELQRFIKHESLVNHAAFQLMDFNEETLDYTKERIDEAMNESGNKPIIKFVHKSIDELLKEIHHSAETDLSVSYDMVYCAGLFDYFSYKTCKQLTELYFSWLAPGGLLTVTNVHANHPNIQLMEHLLDWYLFYRDAKEMAGMAPPNTEPVISTDETGVNVFLDIRKL
jgi:extracellular factor (EF) 3-hydroxypalmitic acid methyl ester biosynthesis protein